MAKRAKKEVEDALKKQREKLEAETWKVVVMRNREILAEKMKLERDNRILDEELKI